jgi:hypothetical protein
MVQKVRKNKNLKINNNHKLAQKAVLKIQPKGLLQKLSVKKKVLRKYYHLRRAKAKIFVCKELQKN